MSRSWGQNEEEVPLPAEDIRITVLAVIGDEQTRALLPRVLVRERLIIAGDLVRALAFAQSESPDVVFVDLTLGNGAGLTMVHHMKAISPETHVFAMVTKDTLEAGAHAVALGGAGLLLMPLSGDELLNAIGAVKARVAEKTVRAELASERERLRDVVGIKDPTTSAYSLAFYADIAGREIYRAGRYGRRLAMMMILLDPPHASGGSSGQRSPIAALVTDHVLRVASDPTLIGRVDEDELHVLLPETDGIGAHILRRRLLLALGAGGGAPSGVDPRAVLVGAATFLHDGQDLPRLMRAARRRAEASARSVVHTMTEAHRSVPALLGLLESITSPGDAPVDPTAPAWIELPMDEAAALAGAAVSMGLRGGATLVIATYRPAPSVFRSVRASMGGGGPGVTLRVLDIRSSAGCDDIEALVVLSEHGAYTLVGRAYGNVFRGAHSSDPLLADMVAMLLGRSTGANLFG